MDLKKEEVMDLKKEFEEIDKFFESKSPKELDDMLIRNGIMNNKYMLEKDVSFSFSYRNSDYSDNASK